jgi:hypothetical protein
MATKEKSLYDRLGSKPNITAVVNDLSCRDSLHRCQREDNCYVWLWLILMCFIQGSESCSSLLSLLCLIRPLAPDVARYSFYKHHCVGGQYLRQYTAA